MQPNDWLTQVVLSIATVAFLGLGVAAAALLLPGLD
jgi:hypothetical protein